jgi:hypothetical protein
MGPKKVHIWCILGAGISFPVFGSRSLHRHITTTNAKMLKHCELQLSISSSNEQFEASKSFQKPPGTKWHHPQQLSTAISRVEASNSDQLASLFSQLPQLPPVNVPLFHSHRFAVVPPTAPATRASKKCIPGVWLVHCIRVQQPPFLTCYP